LGTPFAWRNPVTDATSFTPFNPWGELLATHPDRGPPWESQGQVPTTGFTLAADSVFALPPLGLAGHIYDREVGLVQMHHRSYSPRLGQFATPDYRAPNLYDPSTFTEPYAYAAGNPMLFMDPNGLDPSSKPFREKGENESQEDYVAALIAFLSHKDFLTNERDKYPGYTNFDPGSLLFTKITTPLELEYQQMILAFILSSDINSDAREVYSHLDKELEGVKGAYLDKRKGWFFNDHEIWWTNRFKLSSDGIHITDQANPLTEWQAKITNYGGQVKGYELFKVLEGLLVARGSGVNGGNQNIPGLFPTSRSPEVPAPKAIQRPQEFFHAIQPSKIIRKHKYNMVDNPGPLAAMRGMPASNFAGGKYNAITLKEDVILYRGGKAGGGRNAFGQWFTKERPSSNIQVRIDSAVRPQWIDIRTGVLTGESPIGSVYAIRIPKGTVIYEGPVGYQGGIYLGGQNQIQIFVPQPWLIPNVEVVREVPFR
jgi:RHS repeat-associated protein